MVTGAAQGIGQAIAEMFVIEGATVFATDLDPDKVTQAVPGATALRLDVTCAEEWSNIAETLAARHGKLHILVNNAGNVRCGKVEDCTLDEWRFLNAVHSEGPFLGIKACLPLLRIGAHDSIGGASVINMSSIAGIAALPDQSAYNTSKAAIAHLSKSLAVEFAHHGYNIRVNSIHPGTTLTPLLERALTMLPDFGDSPLAVAAGMCPLKRLGAPSDVAYGALYLASEEAGYVTGTQLIIDGGMVDGSH